jgi:hypothetical protein
LTLSSSPVFDSAVVGHPTGPTMRDSNRMIVDLHMPIWPLITLDKKQSSRYWSTINERIGSLCSASLELFCTLGFAGSQTIKSLINLIRLSALAIYRSE